MTKKRPKSKSLSLPKVPRSDSISKGAKKRRPAKKFDRRRIEARLQKLKGGPSADKLTKLKRLHNQIRSLEEEFESLISN